MEQLQELLKVTDLKVYYDLHNRMIDIFVQKNRQCHAVDGVSLTINRGEIVSLVGESGSGKTTIGKAILRLVDITGGEIQFNGKEIGSSFKKLRRFRQQAQMIYQDPYQSLNPRASILDIVAEPLDINNLVSSEEERTQRVKIALEQAGLVPAEDYFFRYPFELSGGQRQRVAIAGALILEPDLIIADEPVSMLDASIRTGIVKLMLEMCKEKHIAFLFITHDLSLAWLISDRIAIMYLGKIMEIGSSEQIIRDCRHPYTKALVNIMPVSGVVRTEKRRLLKGETPDASIETTGCKFYSRCPDACDRCLHTVPELKDIGDGHCVACIFS